MRGKLINRQEVIKMMPHLNLVRYTRQYGKAIKSIAVPIKYLIQSKLSFRKLKIKKDRFIYKAPFIYKKLV